MIRYIPLALLYLALALGGLDSTPKRVGPTPSGYFFSIRVSETEIGQAYYPELEFDDDYPISAEFVVEVQNAQGQVVDDILVKFEVDPARVENTAIFPQQATTRGGTARVVLLTTSLDIVRFMVRVDHTTQEVVVAVADLGRSSRY